MAESRDPPKGSCSPVGRRRHSAVRMPVSHACFFAAGKSKTPLEERALAFILLHETSRAFVAPRAQRNTKKIKTDPTRPSYGRGHVFTEPNHICIIDGSGAT